MKRNYTKYIYNGLTALAVIFLSIAFFFVIFKFSALSSLIHAIIQVLMPFVYGLGLAYLLTPVFNFFERGIRPALEKRIRKPARAHRLSKILSTTLTMLFAFLLVGALMYMVLPELINSVMGIVNSNLLQDGFDEVLKWSENLLQSNAHIESAASGIYDKAIVALTSWIQKDMLPQLTSVMNGLLGTVTFAKNLFVGIFITIYVLNGKETFAAQAKKLTYSIFSVPHANLLIGNVRFIHRVFGGFINGKLLDSLIIGVICFIGMSFFKLPYPMLISVVIGVTNIIPFFGPFIGAIPSCLLILMISPIQALYFLIFVLVLQQFDGNILGPKILGDSTGLSSFWVMFAILVFGGLFGFAGMVLGVPVFAVIYSMISALVNHSLERRTLPQDTRQFHGLDHINPQDGAMCYESTGVFTSVKTKAEKPDDKAAEKPPQEEQDPK